MYFLPVSLFLISIWDNFGATTADSSCMNWILMLYIFKRKASVQRSKTHFPLPDKPQGLFVCFTGPLEHIGKWKQRSVLSLPWLFFHKTTISYWSVLNDKHKCLGKTQFLLTFSNYFYMAAEILWVGKINTSLILILLFSFFFFKLNPFCVLPAYIWLTDISLFWHYKGIGMSSCFTFMPDLQTQQACQSHKDFTLKNIQKIPSPGQDIKTKNKEIAPQNEHFVCRN